MMFEPTTLECILLAMLTVLVIVGIISKLPKLQHYTDGGNYTAEKIKPARDAIRFELAPVRKPEKPDFWQWENDLHE